MKNRMKDTKITALSFIVAMLSLLTLFPLMFEFVYAEPSMYVIYGFQLYVSKSLWRFVLFGVLGLVALLWNLVFGVYSVIDGRYRNLTWRIARYGYFHSMVAGIINFAALIGIYGYLQEAAYAFLVFLAVIIALEIALIFSKDEDTKNKLNSDT